MNEFRWTSRAEACAQVVSYLDETAGPDVGRSHALDVLVGLASRDQLEFLRKVFSKPSEQSWLRLQTFTAFARLGGRVSRAELSRLLEEALPDEETWARDEWALASTPIPLRCALAVCRTPDEVAFAREWLLAKTPLVRARVVLHLISSRSEPVVNESIFEVLHAQWFEERALLPRRIVTDIARRTAARERSRRVLDELWRTEPDEEERVSLVRVLAHFAGKEELAHLDQRFRACAEDALALPVPMLVDRFGEEELWRRVIAPFLVKLPGELRRVDLRRVDRDRVAHSGVLGRWPQMLDRVLDLIGTDALDSWAERQLGALVLKLDRPRAVAWATGSLALESHFALVEEIVLRASFEPHPDESGLLLAAARVVTLRRFAVRGLRKLRAFDLVEHVLVEHGRTDEPADVIELAAVRAARGDAASETILVDHALAPAATRCKEHAPRALALARLGEVAPARHVLVFAHALADSVASHLDCECLAAAAVPALGNARSVEALEALVRWGDGADVSVTRAVRELVSAIDPQGESQS